MWGDVTELPLPDMGDAWWVGRISVPETLTPEISWLLGALTADGHVTRSNYTVGITKNEVDVLDRFERIVSGFGLSVRRRTDARNGVTSACVSSKAFVMWLDTVGFSKEAIPLCIRRSTRENVLAYLSGLYLDGYISQSVSISQRHGSLIRDIQLVWDNLGVKTYINDNVVQGTNYPVLHVAAGHRARAARLIDWDEAHKKKRVPTLKNGQGPGALSDRPLGRDPCRSGSGSNC